MFQEILAFIKKNPNKVTYTQLCAKFKKSRSSVYGIITRGGLNHLILKELSGPRSFTREHEMAKKTSTQLRGEARLESQLRAKSNQQKESDKKYRLIQDELHKTKKALEHALAVTGHRPHLTAIRASKREKDGEGTAVILASDWHVDELVPKHKVNGLNEFTPEIAKRRAAKFFDLALRFLRVDRGETHINNMVLWLGGDFFTSSTMHDAPVAYPPVVACMVAQDLLISGIVFILKEEPNLKIHVVGSVGNHSRLSGSAKPVNPATEQELSLEWMMYHAIAQYFKDEERVTFQLDNSYNSYVTVYNKTIRFAHGHMGWRYIDGMGGVHGPFWKYISQRADKQIKADLSVAGHYHTYTPAARGRAYIVNGSLIGATPYSLNYGFEEPIQAYFLVHSKYGIVGQRPLFVDV